MTFLWKSLHTSLDQSRSTSWRNLAKRLGVTPSIFTRISQGRPISVENLIKVLGGLRFEKFVGEKK